MKSHHNATHGLSASRLYHIHDSMLARCHRPSHVAYHRYSKKGITVCSEWRSNREVFFKWSLENGYTDLLEIDRIDNSKGYYPENCRWVTRKQNQDNKDCSCILSHNGESMNMSDWARKLGWDKTTIAWRRRKGWSDEKILTTPIRSKR